MLVENHTLQHLEASQNEMGAIKTISSLCFTYFPTLFNLVCVWSGFAFSKLRQKIVLPWQLGNQASLFPRMLLFQTHIQLSHHQTEQVLKLTVKPNKYLSSYVDLISSPSVQLCVVHEFCVSIQNFLFNPKKNKKCKSIISIHFFHDRVE